MQALIDTLAQQFGMKPEQVRSAAGAVLGLIREHAGKPEFAALIAALPGAQDWIGQAASPKPPAGGGGLLGQASGLLGALGAGASAPGGVGVLLGQLQQAGLRPETAMQFLPALLDQFKSAAGPETLSKILDEVPGLQVGGGASSPLKGLFSR